MRLTKQRRAAIVREVMANQIVRVSELSAKFGVSEVSIRRDLTKLEEQGLLTRIRGGAVRVSHELLLQPFGERMRLRAREKEEIGHMAASLIESGDRIILDSGTTVLQVAKHIPQTAIETGELTIITASFPAFCQLARYEQIHLLILGGIYLFDYQTLVGPQTVANLQRLHVDKLFLGADGLTFSKGLTTANILEAEVTRAMVEAAARVIVVADSSKIGKVGFTTIIPLTEISTLVTDGNAPADFVEALRQEGVEVILVQT